MIRAMVLSFCVCLTIGTFGGETRAADAKSKQAKLPDDAIYLTAAELEEIRRGSACKSFVKQILQLKNRMSTSGITTDFYELRVISTTEMVRGKSGTYYAVVLKDARRKRRFRFGGGRYVIKRFETRFRASLAAFTRDVLAPLQSGVEYQMYVRGSASARPMRRTKRQTKKLQLSEVQYLPAVGDDYYDANAAKRRALPNKYGNDDLPYLRAAFLQKVVSDTIQFAKPIVLESKVSNSKSRSAQFAEILLFVSWK